MCEKDAIRNTSLIQRCLVRLSIDKYVYLKQFSFSIVFYIYAQYNVNGYRMIQACSHGSQLADNIKLKHGKISNSLSYKSKLYDHGELYFKQFL